jgi:hypothetical protein
LLRAMGAETANLHLASAGASQLSALTARPARRWLAESAARMLADTVSDWLTWRRWQGRRPGPPDRASTTSTGPA